MFTVPRATPGLEIVETWDTMSMRATASVDLVIKDCWVPEAAMVGVRQPGDADVGAHIILPWFCGTVASAYRGVAIVARDLAYDRATPRKPVALERPIADFRDVQFPPS